MGKASINELMGKGGSRAKSKDLSLDDLHEILGERMPKLDFSPVGRYRLTTALRNRFGDNYRNLPGIDNILKEFDKETEFNINLQKMKMIKGK